MGAVDLALSQPTTLHVSASQSVLSHDIALIGRVYTPSASIALTTLLEIKLTFADGHTEDISASSDVQVAVSALFCEI